MRFIKDVTGFDLAFLFVVVILALLAIVTLASAASADVPGDGTGLYTFAGYSGTYYRTQTAPGYYWCGRYYPATYSYHLYTPAVQAAAPKLPDYKDPDAIDKLIAIKTRALAQTEKANTFATTAKALGFDLTAAPNQVYASNGLTPYGGGYSTNGYAYRQYQNTSSVYSALPYDPNQVRASAFNPNNALLQLNQSQATTAQIFAQGQDGIQKIVGDAIAKVSDRDTEVARINAQTHFAVQLLKSMGSQSTLKEQGFKFSVTPAGTFQLVPPATVDKGLWTQRSTEFVKNTCAACHYGDNIKGGFDVSTWAKLAQKDRDSILRDWVTTDNEAKRMPRIATGDISQVTLTNSKAGPRIEGENFNLLRTPVLD